MRIGSGWMEKTCHKIFFLLLKCMTQTMAAEFQALQVQSHALESQSACHSLDSSVVCFR